MCIKIFNSASEAEYDMQRPLEDQVGDSDRIVIDYSPEDSSIEKFVGEVERICKNGISCNLNIEVITNSILKGAKIKRQAKALEFDLKLNDLIKLMTIAQSHADKKLEEMSELCLKR
jgi:hypothetical protein